MKRLAAVLLSIGRILYNCSHAEEFVRGAGVDLAIHLYASFFNADSSMAPSSRKGSIWALMMVTGGNPFRFA